jgi:dTDP-4-dehydrorhamnose 3,5-epimerase
MEIKYFDIEGLIEILPKKYEDNRGYLFESYNEDEFKKININDDFIQDKQSFSKKGVIRGLHLQKSPFEQGKLVRIISGKVLDVAVDVRNNSKTYGQYVIIELSAEKGNVFYIPKGFAHGFVALEDSIFNYKCSGIYNKESEVSINPLDKYLNINWSIEKPILSEKDTFGLSFSEYTKLFN